MQKPFDEFVLNVENWLKIFENIGWIFKEHLSLGIIEEIDNPI